MFGCANLILKDLCANMHAPWYQGCKHRISSDGSYQVGGFSYRITLCDGFNRDMSQYRTYFYCSGRLTKMVMLFNNLVCSGGYLEQYCWICVSRLIECLDVRNYGEF